MLSQNATVTVDVGLFSGRRNPQLTLSEEATLRLLALLRETLHAEATAPPKQMRLGRYYGFMITLSEGLVGDLHCAKHIAVYDRVLSEQYDGHEQHWRDSAGLERFLLEQAQLSGLGSFLKRGGVEINQE